MKLFFARRDKKAPTEERTYQPVESRFFRGNKNFSTLFLSFQLFTPGEETCCLAKLESPAEKEAEKNECRECYTAEWQKSLQRQLVSVYQQHCDSKFLSVHAEIIE